ncbi:hypothetical protein AGLY_015893 [Aphis glycines]|uniref:Uncharacterized protein n=1 Tax=Aphis glycines TaxID=307491 RepID=A0A6G0T001_APHGL|nr:hypothetical protein AGLY_015893 [Aphis glycines]
MHVGSVQYQIFLTPNDVQMPQVMLPYQPFPSPSVGPPPPMPPQTPTSVMQPTLASAEIQRRPPTVAVANANNNSTAGNSYYYHHRPNEQHISYSSCGGVPSENGLNNEYRQMEVERMVNRHQRGNRGHTENRQAEAAVYQHFEESLKLAQQQMTPNNPVIHVGSAQHQNFFLPNAVQMPHRMLPYQPFPSPSVGPPPPMPPQTPTPVMQPALGAAEMLWRPPTATVANANSYSTAGNGYYYHHRSNEQQILYSSRGNVEKDAYKEMKIAKQPQYAQGSAGGSKSKSGAVPSENSSNKEYRQVEIERMVNRHQRGNRERTEEQQAEEAFHQHFEESLKLAQQHRLQVHYRNVPITNSTTYNSSPSTPPPVLIPATNTETSSGIRTRHQKLKRAWLQRHVWAEGMKAAGVNIDQNWTHSFSQMDDTPPVLHCEIIKKRKLSKSLVDDNSELTLPCTSSTHHEKSTSSDTTHKCRKRKTRVITDNAGHSETEKRVPPIKSRIKLGRKPKVVVSIPLKKTKK